MKCTLQKLPDGTTLTDLTLTVEKQAYEVPAQLVSLIDQFWQVLQTKRGSLTSEPLFRVLNKNLIEPELRVSVDITYKDIVGIRNTEDFTQFFAPQEPPAALSIIMLVYTSDQQLVLVERQSGDWPHSIELPGGFARPVWGTDLLQQACMFLDSDLGVSLTDIQSHTVRGFVTNPNICELLITTAVSLRTTFEELVHRAPKTVYCVPEGYRQQDHANYFSLPFHEPSKDTLKLWDLI